MPKPKQTKTARLRAMLARPSGATLDAICKTTGWQRHSARAAVSGLRKTGHVIERTTGETGAASIYRIIGSDEAES